ncbi:hypothetical protein predicted by Glimmer/Critica [Lactiplantibacillus plantarum]|nr:hypothetical protein predicted by Glimmer/Critica [Lactiplantibacillus plantarum]
MPGTLVVEVRPVDTQFNMLIAQRIDNETRG